jgi:hypothetical protein
MVEIKSREVRSEVFSRSKKLWHRRVFFGLIASFGERSYDMRTAVWAARSAGSVAVRRSLGPLAKLCRPALASALPKIAGCHL